MISTLITLRKVQPKDSDFLYLLYNQRDPRRNTPPRTSQENEEFVLSYITRIHHYYSAWYIVMVDNKRAGAYTITRDNETGSWLLPEYCNKGIGYEAYQMLFKLEPRNHYTVKVEAWDKRTQALIDKLGFTFIRSYNHTLTYSYDPTFLT